MSFAPVAESLETRLRAWRGEMIAFQRELTACPAIGPDNGGPGEAKRAALVEERLRGWGLGEILRIDAEDPRAEDGLRPNLVASLPGGSGGALWIMAHLDVVPEGDPALWESPPFEMVETADRLVGRGVEDNQQGLVAALFAARALREEGADLPGPVHVLLCADEETGSAYGLEHVLETRPDLFDPRDLVVVPDVGEGDGAMIEVSEKGLLWLKLTVHGRQTHASMPQRGVNSLRALAELVIRLERLGEIFHERDALYEPATSTFEPTRTGPGVANVNTVPGESSVCLDCRLLPGHAVEAVTEAVRGLADEVERARGVRITLETIQCHPSATPTPADAPVVKALQRAVGAVCGVEARPRGFGGNTVAACFRRRGLPAAAWATIDLVAHQANEYCIIDHMVGDACVFARLALDRDG